MRKGSITSSIVSRGSLKPGGERLHADRSAAIQIGDHGQIAPVHRVETKRVDLQPRQRFVGDLRVDRVRARGMGEIAYAAEQPPGDARSAARPARDLTRRHPR